MSLASQLPPSLNLPPHLSAQKYFVVCSLTVAAWDTLVLSPRTWRLFKTEGWPVLKIAFHFIRFFMPIEFTIVAVAFFDTTFSQSMCRHFYLFEPICTAILLAVCSAVHVIRIDAIYDRNRLILAGLAALFVVQIVVTAAASAFFTPVPLEVGQGCIAGPKASWVGIYWIAPTVLYLTSFLLAASKSVASLKVKPLSLWKLMLRDGLNLYGTILIVNLANVIFWFVIKPTGPEDPIRTIITSMAAVLTTSMTLRIILSVRGSLSAGGTFSGGSSTAHSGSSRTTHITSLNRSGANNTQPPHTFMLDDLRSKAEGDWLDSDVKVETNLNTGGRKDGKDVLAIDNTGHDNGVRITIDREVGYDSAYPHAK